MTTSETCNDRCLTRFAGIGLLLVRQYAGLCSRALRLRPAGFIEPCLPTLARTVPNGPRWAFEIKHDGFRFVARRDGDRVRVFSRNAKDWTDKVPAIVDAMLALPVTSATLDGEGVAIDDRGVTDFRAAAVRIGRTRRLSRGVSLRLRLARTRWQRRAPSPVGNPPRDPDRPPPQGRSRRSAKRAPRRRRRAHLPARVRAWRGGHRREASDRPYRSGRCADWIKIKNPDAPAAARIMEW
jgi:bifunctional non-homologous end joining protein LigD